MTQANRRPPRVASSPLRRGRVFSLLGAFVVAWIGLLSMPPEALARTGETLGIVAPPVTPVDVPDAWAYDVNPGAAAFHRGWSLVFGGSFLAPTDRGAMGVGGLFGVPIAFGLSAGFGLQYLSTASGADEDEALRYTRITLGAAYALGKRIGIGLAYHHFYSENAPFAGVDTWDAGVVLRVAPALAFAAAVHDIGDPVYAPSDDPGARTKTPREWSLAVAIRPVAFRNPLTITIGGRITEPGGLITESGKSELGVRVAPFANLELRTRAGITVRIDAEFPVLPTDDARPFTPRITAGLELGFGAIGVGGAAFAATSKDGFDSSGGMAYASLYGERVGPPLRRRRIVEVSLSGTLEELAGSTGPLRAGSKDTHLVLLLKLDRLASASDVDAVVLRLRGLKLGMGQLTELVAAVEALKAAGKTVYCHGNGAGTRTVALCSHAERFAVSPPATVRLLGLLSEVRFLRGAFDKIGAEPEFIRIAEYKSSPEMFTEKGPTPENKAVREETLGNLYTSLVEHLSSGMSVPEAHVRELIDAGPYTPERAKAAGLIDEVAYWEAFKTGIMKAHPRARWGGGSKARTRGDDWPRNRAIAVLVVEGAITSGRSALDPLSGRRTAGAVTLVRAIRRIVGSPRYAAMVVRINSPGGSALASDLIWAELARARARMPVIISMGDITASGGYYIAAAGEEVFATPGTITGSIGIYTGKFSLAGLYDWAGIHVETFKRGEHADLFSMSRPLTPEERAFAMENLRYYYDEFLDRVAKGRKMTPEAVDRIARGRVWTGRPAKELGLVDTFGGLTAALTRAKTRAGIPAKARVPVEVFPKPPGDLVSVALRWLGLARAKSKDAPGAVGTPTAEALRGLARVAGALLPTWATFVPGTPLALWDDGDAYVPSD